MGPGTTMACLTYRKSFELDLKAGRDQHRKIILNTLGRALIPNATYQGLRLLAF